MPLKIVFAGTPEFAAAHLQTLLDSEHNVIAAYTQPDRPVGRGKQLQPSPVKALAEAAGVPVYQPLNFKHSDDIRALAELEADIMVVVAYGLLLPQAVLDSPRYGCINVHASLLPRWRGAAPIQRAVEAGDADSGVTIMQMDAGLDTGPMLEISRCALGAEETGGSLHDKLLELGGPALLKALAAIEAGSAQPQQQPEQGVTYAHKFSKADAALDWQRPAAELERMVRAYNPFPVAHCGYSDKGKPQRLRVWCARAVDADEGSKPGTVRQLDSEGLLVQCGRGTALLITQLQLPGKKAMTIKDLLNGRAELFSPGQQLD